MNQIINDLTAYRTKLEGNVGKRASVLQSAIANVNDALATVPTTSAIANLSAVGEVESTYALIEAKPLVTRRVESEVMLERRREQMGYLYPPVKVSKLLAGLTVGCVFCAEAIANSLYFISTSDQFATTVAAMSVAATLSATNMLIGGLTGAISGRYLRFGVNAVEDGYQNVRRIAWAKLSGASAFYAAFMYQTAGVRQQGALSPVEFSVDRLQGLLTDPNTLALTVVMFAGAWLAYKKAIAWDGEDTEYTQLGRDVDDAQEDLEDWVRDSLSALVESVDEEVEALQEAQEIGRENSDISKLIVKCQKKKQALDKAISKAEASMARKMESLMRVHIKGKPTIAEVKELRAMCRFDDYRTIAVPARPTAPDYSAQIKDLQDQKSKLIKQYRGSLEKLIKKIEADYE